MANEVTVTRDWGAMTITSVYDYDKIADYVISKTKNSNMTPKEIMDYAIQDRSLDSYVKPISEYFGKDSASSASTSSNKTTTNSSSSSAKTTSSNKTTVNTTTGSKTSGTTASVNTDVKGINEAGITAIKTAIQDFVKGYSSKVANVGTTTATIQKAVRGTASEKAISNLSSAINSSVMQSLNKLNTFANQLDTVRSSYAKADSSNTSVNEYVSNIK